jgi:hypothetical protein
MKLGAVPSKVKTVKYMGCYLLSEAVITNRRVTVAPPMHQVPTLAL